MLLLVAVAALLMTGEAAALKVPHFAWGACPFERCAYGEWTANETTPVLRDRREGAAIAFTVASGERVTAVTGVVITTRFGRARATEDTTIFSSRLPVKRGDVLTVIHYVGESAWLIERDGTVDSWEIEPVTGETFSGSPLRMEREPLTEWWIQVRNHRGQIGWTKAAESFDVD